MAEVQKNTSFSALLQRFFVDHLQQHRSVSPRTIAAYRDTFRLLLIFAERRFRTKPQHFTLEDLNAKLILAFLDHLEADRKNCPRSRNARLAALRSFLKYAAHHDISALHIIEQALSVPMKRIDRPLLGFLSREEMQAVLDAPDPDSWVGQRDRTLFTVLYNTGARVSEILHLRLDDLVLDGGAPAVHLHGKGRKQRSVPLWRSTASLLRSWRKRLNDSSSRAFLFPNRSGTLMTRSNVTQRLADAVGVAAQRFPDLPRRSVSPHTIRHTTAMHLLQSGVDITVIALWLGHESPATTHMYIEADITMKERALNRLQPVGPKRSRYQPPDQLMQFLVRL
ncbi:MAG TPA: tyrosine-type recombinase/integrase [Edaphobacter sp.]|jgi:site-specific recombinase XerD|uniref:tyrosine-type recombinase/integrase n=1 Tax=Edaphobacter sp. TaxID=1934404 RepID=UPI002D18EED0|nr:tyrosine-type recombinase/integrase [Edaphobacter sp.]HUZ95676.1 tyrosine-type recombinase/integrase [Edaphobacter sp.]